MQSQLVCIGCRNLLLYPRGATNVCCAVCNTISSAPPPGTEMAQIICGGCRTLLMFTHGAATVRCSCCSTINLNVADGRYHSPTNQVAHINCGQCHTTLMYPYGAPSVKCSICQYVTNAVMTNGSIPFPTFSSVGSAPPHPSTSSPLLPQQNQTVVVENPMSVDERGKLVSNVVVGVSTEKK